MGRNESSVGPKMKKCADAMEVTAATTAGDPQMCAKWKCQFLFLSFVFFIIHHFCKEIHVNVTNLITDSVVGC